jgi:putative tryptophan/tyrosine transport system substrate-binding protein
MRRREFIAGLGGAVAWPVATRAQQPAVPAIGLLSWGDENSFRSDLGVRSWNAFRQGLGEAGYVEGVNVAVLYRWAGFQSNILPAMAAELVARKVAVIVTVAGLSPALAAKAATTTIPIVFEFGADPVAIDLVASLNRPGGNITGATFLTQELVAKRLEVLHEAVPSGTSIGYLVNPGNPLSAAILTNAKNAARMLGIDLVVINAATPDELEAALMGFATPRIAALNVDTDNLFTTYGAKIAAAAMRHGLPAIFGFRGIVEAGGLMSYGADVVGAYRVAGAYTGRILKGERPADLPVQQSTKVEFVINMKTAASLGLSFPLSLLGRADEVIE